MQGIGDSIAFRLRGKKSNRDAIGTAITVEGGPLHQTKYLQAGSGFLAQHTKEVFFGLGKPGTKIRAVVRWPSGLSQEFEGLPVNHRIEIEEGSPAFAAKPFATSRQAAESTGPPTAGDVLPSVVETWLIEPLKAPEFSLPDLGGTVRTLSSLRGGFVLLNFWGTADAQWHDQLSSLSQQHSALSDAHITIVAINVDSAADLPELLAAGKGVAFPILRATEEVLGIYNIIDRYLFDRRRDLAIPTSFLVDKEGMIVKVYQGAVDTGRLLEDVKSVPGTEADRVRRALPFGGTLCQAAFQRNDFTYGVALFQHGYLKQAAESFQQVVANKPDNPEGYYNLGTLKLQSNDYQQASHFLEQAVKLRPNYPEAWNNLGMVAAHEGHPEDAVRNFQQSLSLRPEYVVALMNLGNLYRRQGTLEKAQELLSRAIEIEPDDPEVSYSLGMLYAQQNQMQRASDYLQKAVKLRPDYPEALNNLGVLFVREQDFVKAEEQFKTCIRAAPGYDQSYLNLARLYAMQNDRAKARDVLHELLRLQPEHEGARHALEVLQ
jgi:Flp pilus assembly protein TadD/peroxiredoxin